MHKPSSVRIFGVPVHNGDRELVLAEMQRAIRGDRQPRHICITSSELMFHARRFKFIPEYAERAAFSLCDSAGVALNGLLRGTMIRRLTGPMLMEQSFDYGAQHGWRHFFCGGAEGVADGLAMRMSRQVPGFISAGTFSPPFGEQSPDDEARMIRLINESGADVLWVGLGVVKQESWIERYIDEINVPWLIGVGGAFDYFAGTVARAPKAVRAVGMEWSYRLLREPWRYKRISTNLLFGLEGVIDAATGRAPYFRTRPTSEVQAPEWRGKRKELQKL